MIKFSVLISLYYKEDPLFFSQAIESIVTQSLQPTEVIIVKDGPLTEKLDKKILYYINKYPNFRCITLSNNQGLGKALNEGLKYCNYDLIARMDTDDIAKPDRFEKQVKFMVEHPNIDACSAWIEEFIGDQNNIISQRTLPETSEELYRFGKNRNPLNHPCVIFRKKAVLAAGGYQHFPLFEDYYLWVRMLMNGSQIYNLQESLLYFRSSAEMFKRRGGFKYALTEMKFQKVLHEIGYINLTQMIRNCTTRFIARIIPNKFREILYKRILHK